MFIIYSIPLIQQILLECIPTSKQQANSLYMDTIIIDRILMYNSFHPYNSPGEGWHQLCGQEIEVSGV